SAGQAAIFLANNGRRVQLLVRSGGLSASMSRYLIRRIEETPHIVLRLNTEITALHGNGRLEEVTWRTGANGRPESQPIGHVFLMTGGVPNTEWLQDCVALDEKGFVRTGPDLHVEGGGSGGGSGGSGSSAGAGASSGRPLASGTGAPRPIHE